LTRPGLPGAGPDAVLAAVRDNRLHSAGVDVFDPEPLGAAGMASASRGRLFALPHFGAANLDTRTAMVDLALRSVEVVEDGSPALTSLPGAAGRPALVTR
jgi:glyoxylate reductase